jgi:hypothetical protein
VVDRVQDEIYPLLGALQRMERSEQFDEIHKAKLFIQDILHLGGLETRNDVLAWLRSMLILGRSNHQRRTPR